MSLQEFIKKYNNKSIEVTGSANAKNQCVDLANAYIREVLRLPIIEWTDAKDFLNKAGDKYEIIQNTPTGIPEPGDIIVWGDKVGGGHGHIGMFIEGDVNNFTSFDQNWSVSQISRIENHKYNSVIGWLRPKKNNGQENELIKCQDKVGYLERTLSDMQRDYKAEKTAKENLQVQYKELEDKNQGLRTTVKQWEEFLDKVWDLLKPLPDAGDKNTQTVLGEVKNLIEKEDQLTEELEKVKGWQARYGNLFDKISSMVQYTGDDEKSLLRALHEQLNSPEIPETPGIDPGLSEKSFWQQFFDIIFRKNKK